jgi:uncharacterized protein YjcR
MRRKITDETWEQIKTGYAAGINLGEIARKMNIPEGTVLAHAKRHGWTQQIRIATRELSDAIGCNQEGAISASIISGDLSGPAPLSE